jgi:3-phosphoshikimate 1-carboxyvinyltransferase
MPGLSLTSIQGDKNASKMFEKIGVITTETADAIIIKNTGNISHSVEIDFYNYPDLFPAFLTACAGLNIKARLIGIQNLRHKESNRIFTMTQQLQAVGFGIDIVSANEIKTTGTNKLKKTHWAFSSYNDHRIAMALTPLALINNVSIHNESVVRKSYPGFWQECMKLFNITLKEK